MSKKAKGKRREISPVAEEAEKPSSDTSGNQSSRYEAPVSQDRRSVETQNGEASSGSSAAKKSDEGTKEDWMRRIEKVEAMQVKMSEDLAEAVAAGRFRTP